MYIIQLTSETNEQSRKFVKRETSKSCRYIRKGCSCTAAFCVFGNEFRLEKEMDTAFKFEAHR